MYTTNFKLKVPQENRKIAVKVTCPEKNLSQLQWILVLHGLYSHMDAPGQIQTAYTYHAEGFPTLQCNFNGHGEGEDKSDGQMQDATLSSGIRDLKTVYDYATQNLNIPKNNLVIGANSYGALVALLALEKRLISPESMILVAPFSLNKFRPWIPLLHLVKKIPGGIHFLSQKFKISPSLIVDYLENHTHALSKKDLLGSTAVHFFVGENDCHVSSPEWLKKFCQTANKHSPSSVTFVDNIQARCKVYPGLGHGRMPDEERVDLMKMSINFIKKIHALRSKQKQ